MRKTIYKIARKLGFIKPQVLIDPVMDSDQTFLEIYEKCKDFTMTSKERMYNLYKSTKYIIERNIAGDFVECGVWKGGSSMLILYTLKALNATNRVVYLYDTFAGMTEPSEEDYKFNTNTTAKQKWTSSQKEGYNTWSYASLEEVRQNMQSINYPQDKIIYVKGKVEETIPATMPSQISLLRLDTDWYSSTKHELQELYPLLSQAGILIIDDYGSYAGSKKAVDEYFADKPKILLTRVDSASRVGVKT